MPLRAMIGPSTSWAWWTRIDFFDLDAMVRMPWCWNSLLVMCSLTAFHDALGSTAQELRWLLISKSTTVTPLKLGSRVSAQVDGSSLVVSSASSSSSSWISSSPSLPMLAPSSSWGSAVLAREAAPSHWDVTSASADGLDDGSEIAGACN